MYGSYPLKMKVVGKSEANILAQNGGEFDGDESHGS